MRNVGSNQRLRFSADADQPLFILMSGHDKSNEEYRLAPFNLDPNLPRRNHRTPVSDQVVTANVRLHLRLTEARAVLV
jgi:hypothetical protein